jgi:hypothetical protein
VGLAEPEQEGMQHFFGEDVEMRETAQGEGSLRSVEDARGGGVIPGIGMTILGALSYKAGTGARFEWASTFCTPTDESGLAAIASDRNQR